MSVMYGKTMEDQRISHLERRVEALEEAIRRLAPLLENMDPLAIEELRRELERHQRITRKGGAMG